jgi:carbohydrate-selective porin OprB
VGTGLVMRGPLAEVGLLPGRDRDAAGIGLVWSQPSTSSSPVTHENEYVLEASYVLQLTPTTKLQPDFQVVWNPAFSANTDTAMIFQLQLEASW